MDKETGDARFCKTITKTDEHLEIGQMLKTCKFMGTMSHPNIVKVTECYLGQDTVHLVSPSLKNSHVSLAELTEALDESQIVAVAEKLLEVCASQISKNVHITNLHPGNIFIEIDHIENL